MFAWHTFSALGGLTPTTALALLVAVVLARRGHGRLALEWCALFGLAMLAVAASKIAFYGWGIGSRELGFAGISGHAARAAVVLPVAALVLPGPGPRRLPAAPVVLALVLAAFVAVSRVVLGAHWVAEAASGFALGTLAAAAFAARARGTAQVALPPALLLLCAALVLAAPRREPFNAERWMVVLGVQLSGHDRPYMRWSFQPARQPWKRPCTLRDVLADRPCS